MSWCIPALLFLNNFKCSFLQNILSSIHFSFLIHTWYLRILLHFQCGFLYFAPLLIKEALTKSQHIFFSCIWKSEKQMIAVLLCTKNCDKKEKVNWAKSRMVSLNYILIHWILLDSIYSLELTPPWNVRMFLGKTF